jgi:hypothetical protein
MLASIPNDSLTEVRSTLTQARIIAAARKPRMKKRNQEDTGHRIADPEASKRAGFPASHVGDLVGFHTAHSDGERCCHRRPSPACQHATGRSARRARFTAVRLWGVRDPGESPPGLWGRYPQARAPFPAAFKTAPEAPSWRRGRARI